MAGTSVVGSPARGARTSGAHAYQLKQQFEERTATPDAPAAWLFTRSRLPMVQRIVA